MDKLIEHNENLDPPIYIHSHLESFKKQHENIEVPDLGTQIQQHDNHHYWRQQDILQIKQFQYKFFQNIFLQQDTVPQINISALFLLNFFFDLTINCFGNNKIKVHILTSPKY